MSGNDPPALSPSETSDASPSADSKNVKKESPVPVAAFICRATIEELRADYSLKLFDICQDCGINVSKHRRQNEPFPEHSFISSSTASTSTSALRHVQQQLPQFGVDHKTYHAFIQSFENVCFASKVPSTDYVRLLILSFPKLMEQNWIRHHIVDVVPALTWQEAKTKMKAHFEVYNRGHLLQNLFENCVQMPRETEQGYGDRFIDLCGEMGVEDNNKIAIDHFIHGLCLSTKKELNKRVDFALSLGKPLPIDSIQAVVGMAIRIGASENGISSVYSDNPRRYTHQEHHRKPHCTYHPHAVSHTTEQCLLNPKNRAASSMPVRTNVTTTTTSVVDPKPSKPKCYRCHSTQHLLPDCPIPARGLTRRSQAIDESLHVNNVSNGASDALDCTDGYDYSSEDVDNHEESPNVYNISRNRSDGRRTFDLTKEEFDMCSKEGRCFKCKETGHLARNCTKNNRTRYNKSKNEYSQHRH